MKEVKAYIKSHKLEDVTHALRQLEGLTGMSAVGVTGFGRSGDASPDQLELLEKHVKVEVVCRDELVEEVVSLIQKVAHTGLRGDGKIYVSHVSRALRIETGERGNGAV